MALGFYINNKGCYGCKTCSMTCMNNKIVGGTKPFVREVHCIMRDEPKTFSFLSMACNHCENPACLPNCPQGAIQKLENGIVWTDPDKCIACQTCVQVCPYGAPKYDEETKKVYKCDMCRDRLEQGLLPLCVEACPGMNLEVGDLDELRAKHPEGVQEIPGITPAAAETNPSIVIELDKAFK